MSTPASAAGADRIDLLRTFVRIVDTGSLSAAAAQLGTTQPTISRRLQALERLFGLHLLQQGKEVTILTNRTAQDVFDGRIMNSVSHMHVT